MKETPVNKIMENTLEKMREMVDVSTIIGEPMVTGDTTLIPVSKVTSRLLLLLLLLFRMTRLD